MYDIGLGLGALVSLSGGDEVYGLGGSAGRTTSAPTGFLRKVCDVSMLLLELTGAPAGTDCRRWLPYAHCKGEVSHCSGPAGR